MGFNNLICVNALLCLFIPDTPPTHRAAVFPPLRTPTPRVVQDRECAKCFITVNWNEIPIEFRKINRTVEAIHGITVPRRVIIMRNLHSPEKWQMFKICWSQRRRRMRRTMSFRLNSLRNWLLFRLSLQQMLLYSGCGCPCGYIVTMAKLNYGHILLLIDRLSDALVSSLKPTPVKISHEREGEKDWCEKERGKETETLFNC